MLFTQIEFFFFFAIIFTVYWLLPFNKARKGLLLIGSYVFYAAWDIRFLSLIIISTLVDYIAARWMDKGSASNKRRKFALWVSLIVNLGMLGFFKYFNFFADSLAALGDSMGIHFNHTTLNIVLPVGISFFTFQTLSYTIDVYRKKIKAEKSLLNIAFFVGFFPQLVAGPIVRALDFLPQLSKKREFKDVAVKACLLLFAVGFFKKTAVSDTLAYYVDIIFAAPDSFTALSVFVGVMLYGIQIYCDFSGYTDMAIAAAGLLGYQLPKNFDAPYLSASIVDFWRRWHISLSTWLRDYLYIPLGGNRHSQIMRYRNLMITMLLGGLWHGAAWTFVIWGALHGIALSVNHLWNEYIKVKLPILFSTIGVYVFVHFCWIFFRSSDFNNAIEVITHSVLSEGTNTLPLNVFIACFILGLVHYLWRKIFAFSKIIKAPDILFSIFLAVIFAFSVMLMPSGYQPFIYFQF